MSKNLSVTSDSVSRSFESASGPIDYGFTNDYMFRVVLQQNNRVLKGLICSLLHLQPDEILSVEITNPILLGDRTTLTANLPFTLDSLTFLHSLNVRNFMPHINC